MIYIKLFVLWDIRHLVENELLINVAWRSNANTWLTTGLWPVFVVANRHHQWLMWGSPRATQLLVKYCHAFPGRFLWNPEPAWPTWFHVEDDLREKWKPFPRARTATAAAAAAAGGNDGRMKHFVALGILTKLTFPFLFSVIKVYWILIAESPMIRMGGKLFLSRAICWLANAKLYQASSLHVLSSRILRLLSGFLWVGGVHWQKGGCNGQSHDQPII